MNTLEREIEDLRHEAMLIRQARMHLAKQLATWDQMLVECQNKLFEKLQQQRIALEKSQPYQSISGVK